MNLNQRWLNLKLLLGLLYPEKLISVLTGLYFHFSIFACTVNKQISLSDKPRGLFLNVEVGFSVLFDFPFRADVHAGSVHPSSWGFAINIRASLVLKLEPSIH